MASAGTSRYFNGSILNFNSSPVARIVGISFKAGGSSIDITYPADAIKLFNASPQDDLTVSVKFKGGCALARQATGALTITWNDGTTTTCPGTWQVQDVETTGDWDAPITGSATLKPTTAS